jgi:hypothetical protein
VQSYLAFKLKEGQSIWNLVQDHYQTTAADRPPLLAGIVLPIVRLAPWGMWQLAFVAAASAAQLTWVAASWGVLRTLGLDVRKAAIGIVLLAQASFIFWFSSFPLPKLLGGALMVGAFLTLILLPRHEGRRLEWNEAVLGALAAGLGTLSHPANAVILLPMAALLLARKHFPGIKKTAAMALLYLAVVVPWVSFKSAHEPYSTSLLRYLVTNPNDLKTFLDPSISTWQATKLAYQGMSVGQFLLSKVNNLFELADFAKWYNYNPPLDQNHPPVAWIEVLARARSAFIHCLLCGLGLLALGLIPRSRSRHRKLLLIVSIPAILFTPLVSYQSFSACVPYLPLGAVLILGLLAVTEISAWPKQQAKLFLRGSTAFFVLMWALAVPTLPFHINFVVAGMGFFSLAALVALLKPGNRLLVASTKHLPAPRRQRMPSRLIRRKVRARRA